jgi:hypothetical protein
MKTFLLLCVIFIVLLAIGGFIFACLPSQVYSMFEERGKKEGDEQPEQHN